MLRVAGCLLLAVVGPASSHKSAKNPKIKFYNFLTEAICFKYAKQKSIVTFFWLFIVVGKRKKQIQHKTSSTTSSEIELRTTTAATTTTGMKIRFSGKAKVSSNLKRV